FFAWQPWALDRFLALLDSDVHPLAFVALFALLPPVGVPISVFLIMAGARYGLAGGMGLTLLLMPLHLLACYFLGGRFFKEPVKKMARNRGWTIPSVSGGRSGLYAFFFMVFPGIPYTPKNYLLALTNISLGQYLAASLPAHTLTNLPFVGLGALVTGQSPVLAAVFLVLVVALYVFGHALYARAKNPETPADQD
ncbi:MAG: VTT domain-containing protein, partial [Deltaproteobacteria bacterium]|nr:VTT domain-containing protein [Deltaproteobacteria bacterium]